MKKLFVIVLTGLAIYQLWGQYSYLLTPVEPLYDEPYVVVYGRNSCGFTQQTLKDLKNADIPFEYQNVDDRNVADLLHERMRNSGINTKLYNLPVVDVNSQISVRPNSSGIVSRFHESSL